MEIMIDNTLEQIGLTASESKAYLAALKSGPIGVAKLASEINLTRMAAYNLVQSLTEKGLFGKTKVGNKEKIIAQDPDRLILRISEQKRNLDQQEEKIKQVIPELKAFFSSSQVKPRMTVYEGVEGLKTVYEDTLTTLQKGDEFVAYGSAGEASAILPGYLDDYIRRRVKKQIFFRGIAPLSEYSQELIERDRRELREVRIVPPDKFPFQNEINIYGDKVAIQSFKDRIGVILESRPIAVTQKAIFELAWIGAKYVN